MAVTKTGATSKKVYNPKFIFITPFTDENTKGTTVYQCEEIIRDSTSITQEDNTENPVENELSSTPIINNIQAGQYTVNTEIADMQDVLLKDLLGFEVSTDKKKVFAPAGYVTKYAEFALVFQGADGKYIAAILPKVQLSPTVTIDSLSSSLGRIVLSGTGSLMEVTNGAGKTTTPFYVDFDYTLPEGGSVRESVSPANSLESPIGEQSTILSAQSSAKSKKNTIL